MGEKYSGVASVYELGPKPSVELLRAFYEQLVEPVYPARFPPGFSLAPLDWHLTPEIVHRAPVTINGRLVRPIGTMDVEFLSDELVAGARAGLVNLETHYPCGMKCPGCFSEDATYVDANRFLRWRDVFEIVDDAIEIGLKSLKFLGPGELLENPDLFDILDAAEKRNVPLSIFTKGAELGDDTLAQLIYGKIGITSSFELVKRLNEYDCVRILLGFNSFDPHRQDLMVGSHGVTGHYETHRGVFTKRGVTKYTDKRNKALINLIRAGFNSPERGQRLSLITAPVHLDQIDELPEMYIWAARRNIPLVIAPTMESGPKAKGLMRYNERKDPYHVRLKELFLAVYKRAISEGVIDTETLREQSVSAYMGTAPCNQVANGLYLRLNGQVQMCPGTFDTDTIFGNVHDTSIQDIWHRSPSSQLSLVENNWCQAKTHGMPLWIQREVLAEICGGSIEQNT